jgi:hypothetical protein
MSMQMLRRVTTAVFAGIASFAAVAAPSDPPVPPGRDPGGVAVAIIGPGIDYTQPDIAARLARDGEGEIIGWDFADNDRLPFQESTRGCSFDLCNPPLTYKRLASEAASSRIEVCRTHAPLVVAPEELGPLASAISMASKSPAQIILLLNMPAQIIEAASRRFPSLLFVSKAYSMQRYTSTFNPLPNVVAVGGAWQTCLQAEADFEIIVPAECRPIFPGDGSVVNAVDNYDASSRPILPPRR